MENKPERRRSYDADVDRIAKSIEYLSAATRELLNVQQKQIKRVQRHAAFLTMILGACVGLLVILAVVAYRAEINADKIAALQHRTNSDVLCGLFSVFLNSYNEKSIAAQENITTYRDAFNKIEAGAKTLGCNQTARRAQ